MRLILLLILIQYIQPQSLKASDRTVRIAARDSSPYINELGEERGYFYEIVSRAFTIAGYKIEVEFFPPIRARKMVESGELDALIPSSHGDLYSKTLAFSAPLNGSPVGYIQFKNSPKIFIDKHRETEVDPAVKNLNAKTLWQLTNTESEKMIQKIDMLNQKRVPYIIADKLAAAHVIASQRPHLVGQLEFVQPELGRIDFHVAFSKKSKKYPVMLKDFNAALKKMQDSGEYQDILLRYGVQSEKEDEDTLVIGTVANADMKILEELSPHFLAKHPGIKIRWNIIGENLLRKRIFSSIAMNENDFDIINIGQNETRVYARKGWISPLARTHPSYKLEDLIPDLRRNLSVKGKLYALPFYSESSMTYYRKDIFEAKGLSMPAQPSYGEIKTLAAQTHDPARGVYGICLRGKAGWGENATTITSTVKAFGGQWFDKEWKPQLTDPAWIKAVSFYMDLVKSYSPPESYRNGYSESLALFAKGRCAMWIDATVAASYLSDPKQSNVAGKIGFAAAPQGIEGGVSNWKWTWAFAISNASKKKKSAQKFIEWATSQEYIELVAKYHSWKMIPPGTRISTYKNPYYLANAPFAPFVFEILNVPTETVQEVHHNAQLVELDVAEFPALGNSFGNYMSDVMKGKRTIKEALQMSQREVKRIMYHSGYYR